MEPLKLLNGQGDFVLRNAQKHPEVCFPLVNEGGMISSVTPMLAGDCKTGQNTYLLAPASSETLHESRAGRNFWVRIEGQEPWSAVGQSAPQQAARFTGREEEAVLTGGLLWQQVARTHPETGLLAETLSFVPAGWNRVEIMQVRLHNGGSGTQKVTPIAAIPMYGRSADNIRDHRHVTSLLHRVRLRKHGIDLHPTLTFDERGHKPGTVTYRVWAGDETGGPPESFVPLVRDFVGQGSYDWPQAVVSPETVSRMKAGDTAQGSEVVAALYFAPVELKPGESRRYQIVLTVDDDPAPYLTPEAVAEALAHTKAFWQSAASMSFRTQNHHFDAWTRWVGIQPLLRRICGCSFLPHHDYGRGGRGWRDLWQDSLALLLTDPEQTRQDLLRYFAGVRTDGTNATIIGSKPGEFKADRNNISRVWMDHGFWPLLTVEQYLNETGDDDFLLEEQPYFRDTLPHRGEGTPLAQPGAAKTGTVLEHLLIQTVTAFFDVGEHGHIRLRGADWNDGLDMARERGESVAFTAAYAGNLDTLAARIAHLGAESVAVAAPLAALLDAPWGDFQEMYQTLLAYCREMEENTRTVFVPSSELSRKLRAMGAYLREHIRSTEWVGDGADLHWFNSYYDNSGRQVEGLFGDAVRMMLTGQVFTLLSGTADDRQARQIIRAADWYLCDPSRGGYCLNTDFHEVKLDMGRMFGFSYGSKENGAVFCHMAVMYAYALYSRGFAEEGWRVLEYLYNQSVDFARSRVLPGIPEYFDERGQGMYPYLTGSGSWLLLTLQTQVFGVHGRNGDLMLEPKLLPCHFSPEGAAEIHCTSAGRELLVRYHNPQGLNWGEYRIGKVTCGECGWEGTGGSIVIPREELPGAGIVILDVALGAHQ
ncbi:MAG: cellobiose phosphorylase [Oscillospiraceae bacterium]|nr:cellobiose phosphorylase [Oscillospiraceae bacterium]